MSYTDDLCADTVAVISDWAETLTVHRRTVDYDAAGKSISSWTSVGTFVGDWQPVSADTMRAEAGLSIRSKAVVIGPCNLDIEEDDRIYKEDGTFMYVNYMQLHEEHAEIYLKRDEGSS